MAAAQHVGAVAPGPVTPAESDEALTVGAVQGPKEAAADGQHSAAAGGARKAEATLAARAALLGIEVHLLADGAWLLRRASGAGIGTVHGLAALDAAVSGFETAAANVCSLVRCLQGGAA